MKIMKVAAILTVVVALSFNFNLQAQLQLQTDQVQSDSLVKIVAESQGLPVVPLKLLPRDGTYWEAFDLYGKLLPPMPFLPLNPNLVAYQMADGQFLLDNGQHCLIPQLPKQTRHQAPTPDEFVQMQVDELMRLIAQVQEAQADAQLKAALGLTGEMSSPEANGPAELDFGTNLWLEVDTGSFAPGYFPIILHNTIEGHYYEILSKTDLAATNWSGEAVVKGNNVGEATASLVTNGRTNLFIWACSSGLVIDPCPTTPLQLAQLIMGASVTISNATFTGTNVARGTFTNGFSCALPMDSGVILSSGNVTNAVGPNYSTGGDGGGYFFIAGDADLDNLVGGSGTSDAAVLEFDIISPTNYVKFEYMFASEEYPEYEGLGYDDPMAIFVDGTNIALVPFTSTLISVNTVNGGYAPHGISPTNSQYYVDNADPYYTSGTAAFNIQFDGLTTLLTTQTQISSGITHHIKIAIADYGDQGWDSAVFIKTAPPCQ